MKKNVIFIIITLFITTCLTYIYSYNQKSTSTINYSKMQQNISKKILRLHVIGNSNSNNDQSIKLDVKNKIVDYISPLINNANNLNEATSIIKKNISSINKIASNTLLKHNQSYSVNTKLSTRYFPTKKYGELILPKGDYNALCVELGNANGRNWWCLLYPSLCYIDCTYTTLPASSKNKLRNILTTNEFNYVINKTNGKVKFISFISKLF